MMKVNISSFLGQYLVLRRAMIGQNVRQAQPGEYSFVVSIMKIEPGNPHSGGKHFCNGALITRKDVLTCEHCVVEEDLNSVQMILGTVDLTNGSIAYPIWWQTYDQWVKSNNKSNSFDLNDIADIRLSKKLSSQLEPVKLSSFLNPDLYGSKVVVAGWGKNNEGERAVIMEVGDLKIMKSNDCSKRIEKLSGNPTPMDKRVLCSAAVPYLLLNFGNSGGPLLFRNKLIALNLGTSPTLPNRKPHEKQVNIHLGIHYFRNFISSMKNIS